MQKKKRIYVSITILIMTILMGAVYIKEGKATDSYKDKLIRFHVLANSDSPADQSLKLKVRDRVIKETHDKFKDSKSIDESREIIKENMEEIREIALKEIKENGKNYDVKIELGNTEFPTKSYGNFTLPAGEYEALRILIGEAKGQNWWCVMFPPLCFVDVKNATANEKTQEQMKEYLTEEEYEAVSTSYESNDNQEEDRIVLKSKFAEIFEKSRENFSKVFVSKN